MRNEFDDELNRDDTRRGRRGFDSKLDPSDGDYYLDEDYEDYNDYQDYEEPDYGRSYRTAGENITRKAAGPGKEQPVQGMFRGQSSAGAGQNSNKGGPHSRPVSGNVSGRSQETGRPQASADRSRGTGRPQSAAERGQGTGRPQSSAERGQGTARSQSSADRSQGTGRAQSSAGRGQGSASTQAAARSRNVSGSTQETPRQIVIGDGKTSQQSRRPVQDSFTKSGTVSRSAVQTEKKRKLRRIIIMAVAEIFTLALIFSYAYVARVMNSFQRPADIDPEQISNSSMTAVQKKHMTGYRTIAVFGVDSRDGNVNKGTNADVIIICNINRDTGEIKLVSVFRDTYLNTNEGNTYNKINSAYANGGPAQALAALNKNLDLDISEYVTFNWKSVADGINMLGGVDIDISKAEFRYINSFITETVKKSGVPSVHLKSAGMNHLDGVQAVAYARLRKMDTDFARTERQRLVIQKSFEKAKKADLGLLNRILLMEVEQVGTNLTFSDFTELILDINKYHIGETGGFPFARGDVDIGKKGDCVIPQTLETNVKELHKFLFDKEDYEPSDMVKKISAKIAADSGMYKQGTSIDHVPTDKGYIPEKTTEAVKKEKTTEADKSTEESEFIEETDEFGRPVKPLDESESSTAETKETRPGETTKGALKPGETTTGAPKPGETKPSGTSASPEKPTESNGPGTSHTTAPAGTTSSETTSAGPGSINETTAAQPSSTPAPGTDVPVVSAPPGMN